MAFKGLDFYNVDELLTEEQRMMRKSVRAFVDESVLPVIVEAYEQGHFPTALIREMGRQGVLGANLQGYGCAGIDNVAYGLIMQELERGDSGVRSFASVQGALVMYPIHAFGSEDQKKKWLPKLAAGEAVGCFGLTEAEHGSDPGGMKTRAVKDGKGWVINGSKAWITNGTIADVAVVWARAEEGVRGFLVERGTPGYSASKIEHKASMRASDTAELGFADCRIPAENLLPGSKGLKSPLSCLTQARYGIAWGVLGAAMACLDEAVAYSKSRIQFNKPIGSFQLVQAKLAHMLTELTKGQLLCLRLGQLKDQGTLHHAQVSLAKRNNVAMALECARLTRDILGANGITYDYQAIRHMLNLETVYTYEGTHDIHTLVLGEALTGISAYA